MEKKTIKFNSNSNFKKKTHGKRKYKLSHKIHIMKGGANNTLSITEPNAQTNESKRSYSPAFEVFKSNTNNKSSKPTTTPKTQNYKKTANSFTVEVDIIDNKIPFQIGTFADDEESIIIKFKDEFKDKYGEEYYELIESNNEPININEDAKIENLYNHMLKQKKIIIKVRKINKNTSEFTEYLFSKTNTHEANDPIVLENIQLLSKNKLPFTLGTQIGSNSIYVVNIFNTKLKSSLNMGDELIELNGEKIINTNDNIVEYIFNIYNKMLQNKKFNIKVKRVSTANIAEFTEYINLYDKQKINFHNGEHKPDTTTNNTESSKQQLKEYIIENNNSEYGFTLSSHKTETIKGSFVYNITNNITNNNTSLRIGDKIISINNQDVSAKNPLEIFDELKKIKGKLTISLIGQNYKENDLEPSIEVVREVLKKYISKLRDPDKPGEINVNFFNYKVIKNIFPKKLYELILSKLSNSEQLKPIVILFKIVNFILYGNYDYNNDITVNTDHGRINEEQNLEESLIKYLTDTYGANIMDIIKQEKPEINDVF